MWRKLLQAACFEEIELFGRRQLYCLPGNFVVLDFEAVADSAECAPEVGSDLLDVAVRGPRLEGEKVFLDDFGKWGLGRND